MGYEFTFFSFKGSEHLEFPCDFTAAPAEPPLIPWAEFLPVLMDLGAKSTDDPATYAIEYDNEEVILVSGYTTRVCLDVNANWNRALQIYRKLFDLEPSLVIFDEQEGYFHDEPSFMRWMQQNGFRVEGYRHSEKDPQE